MANAIGEPRTVDAGRGAAWWGEGWRIFTSNVWKWIGIMIVYIVLSGLVSSVPFVGTFGNFLLTPVFLGGLMLGCHAIDRGDPLRVAHLFEGFQAAHFVPLMIIGAVNLALVAAGTLVMAGIAGGFSMAVMMQGGSIEDPFGAMGEMTRAFTGTALLLALLGVVIVAVFAMLNWFAPALVALQGATAVDAMKRSFVACLRNWLPFLVYGAIAIAIGIAAMMVIGVLAVMAGVGTIMALLYGGGGLDGGDVGTLIGIIVLFVVALAVIGLIVGPIVFGSTYASYEDAFAVDRAVPANPAYR